MSGFTGPIDTLPLGATPVTTDILPTWQGAQSPSTRQVTWAQVIAGLGLSTSSSTASTVTGPTTSVSGDIVSFNGTSGKIIQDSGVSVANVVVGPASAVSGNVATFNSTTGKLIQDGGFFVNASVTSALEQTTVTLAMTKLAQQVTTGQYYASLGANIDRLNDRVFIGAATVQNGNTGSTNKTWLAASAGGFNLAMDTISQMEVIGTNGGYGIVSAVRTSDIPVGGFPGGYYTSIAMLPNAQNDSTTGSPQAWAVWAQNVSLTTSANYTMGIEADVTTTVTSVVPDAYNPVPAGFTGCLAGAPGGNIALSGSGFTVNPTSAGLVFFPAGTGANFPNPKAGTGACLQKGIVFDNEVIVGADGFTAGAWGTAIEMAQGHAIVWRTNTGSPHYIGGMIRSDVLATEEANQQRIVFNGNAGGIGVLQVKGVLSDLVTEFIAAGVAVHPYAGSGTPVNNLALFPNTTTNPPVLAAVGSDTNVDLQLLPQGAGVVWLGAASVTASVTASFTANHYITVKDGAGLVRYIPCSTATW